MVDVDNLLDDELEYKFGTILRWGRGPSDAPMLKYTGDARINIAIFSGTYYARGKFKQPSKQNTLRQESAKVTFISLINAEDIIAFEFDTEAELCNFEQELHAIVTVGETDLKSFLRSNIWMM